MITFNGNTLTVGGAWLNDPNPYDPYNPLNLPPYTIRIKYNPYFTPRMGDSQTLVDATHNIWDVTYNSADWSSLFLNESSLLEVLGANTSSVTSMYQTFYNCIYLTNVNVFDTSAVVNMDGMFYRTERLPSVPAFNTISVQYMGSAFELSGITAIPLFNTSSIVNMDAAFRNCRAVQSGALALYQQASGQAYVPTHSQTFTNCGSSTVTGAQELASIPTSWGGTMG